MKVYLAGVEQGGPQKVASEIPNAFYSYYYIRQGPKCIKNAKKYHELVFIDSGAHSFFAETENIGSAHNTIKKSKTKDTPDEYMAKYLIWLVQNYEYYDYYAELDIGEIVGQKKVNYWRQQLIDNNIFDKCVTVYHPYCMDWNDYLEMLEQSQSKYIALEGDRNTRTRLNYNKYLKPAYEQGIKVHGFAMTKIEVMRNYPFYSVDSTSWLQPQMYGTIPIFNKGRITCVVWKKEKEYLKFPKKINLSILRGDDKELIRIYTMKIAIETYKELETYYTNLWNKRGILWH